MANLFRKVTSLVLVFVMLVGMGAVTSSANDGGSSQISDAGGTSYSAETAADSKVIVSKTIESTGEKDKFDITLQVKTTQKVYTNTVYPDAAVVLVIDNSSSMLDCAICEQGQGNSLHKGDIMNACPDSTSSSYTVYEKKNSHNNSCKHCSQPLSAHITLHKCTYQSKMDAAIAAAEVFLDDYVKDAAGAKRWVSIVKFDRNANRVCGWTDAAANMSAVKTQLNAIETGRGTNLEAGLTMANNLLKDARIQTAVSQANQFVVLLTDGEPYHIIDDDADRNSTEVILGTGVSGDSQANAWYPAKQAASTLKTNWDGTLYSIYFNTPTSSAVENLKEISGGNTYTASNASKLLSAFDSIIQQIRIATQAWITMDPMGEYVTFDGIQADTSSHNTQENIYDKDSRTLSWNLQKTTPTVKVIDSATTQYIYTLKYSVTLNTADPKFVSGQVYPTNGTTYLTYVYTDQQGKLTDAEGNPIYQADGITPNPASDGVTGARTLNFKIPAVKGQRPVYQYTVQHMLKDRSGAYVLQESVPGSAELWSSVSVAAKTYANYHYVSGAAGEDGAAAQHQITGNNMTFKLFYDPDLTSVTVNRSYKTIYIDENNKETVSTDNKQPEIITGLYVGDPFALTATQLATYQGDFLTDGTLVTSIGELLADGKQNVLNLAYVKTVDDRVEASYQVIKHFATWQWQLDEATGRYENVCTENKAVPETKVTGLHAFDTRGFVSTAEGYQFDANQTKIVNGTIQNNTVTLTGGDTVLDLYFTKQLDTRVATSLTVNHYYTYQKTEVVDGAVVNTTAPDNTLGASDLITTHADGRLLYQGERYTAYGSKTSYDGVTGYQADKASAAIKLTAENTVDFHYRKATAPETTQVTIEHVYRSWEVYTNEDDTKVYTQITDPNPRVTEKLTGLYLGQSVTPTMNYGGVAGYTFNYLEPKSAIAGVAGVYDGGAVAANGQTITMYYDATPLDQTARIKVNYTYTTMLTSVVAGEVKTLKIELSDQGNDYSYVGKAGEPFTAMDKASYAGMAYPETAYTRLTEAGAMQTALTQGDRSLQVSYTRTVNLLVDTAYTVRTHFQVENMVIGSDGKAVYAAAVDETDPVVDTFNSAVYADMIVSAKAPATAKHEVNGVTYDYATFSGTEENEQLTLVSDAAANVIDLYYVRRQPLPKVTVTEAHTYTSYTLTIENGEEQKTPSVYAPQPVETVLYTGEHYTAVQKPDGYTLESLMVNGAPVDLAQSITLDAADGLHIHFNYVKTNDQRHPVTVTVKHHYYEEHFDNADGVFVGTETKVDTASDLFAGMPYTAGLKTAYQGDVYAVTGSSGKDGAYNAAAYTLTLGTGENEISIYYKRYVETRTITEVQVTHIYREYDSYTGQTTEKSTHTETTNNLFAGDAFTAVPVTEQDGVHYNLVEAAPAQQITLSETGNHITLTYLRTVDTTPECLLTIYYRFQDGQTAAATYTKTVRAGDRYDVQSPAIADYTADKAIVSGQMPATDLVITVYYNKAAAGPEPTPTPTPGPTPTPDPEPTPTPVLPPVIPMPVIPDPSPAPTPAPEEETFEDEDPTAPAPVEPEPTEEPEEEPEEEDFGEEQGPTSAAPVLPEPEEEAEFDEEDPTDAAPNTGDRVNISAVWTLLVLCAGCILFLIRSLRKQRKSENER